MISRSHKIIPRYILLLTVLLGIFVGASVYLLDYYPADMTRIAAYPYEASIETGMDDRENLVFGPEDASAGFVFYPGGKIDHTAYIPLMKELASEDILCVLVKMPFRLAVLDMDAAHEVQQQYPKIDQWYIGGHSLGGAMASSYLTEHAKEYEGLVLLGAYSTADLSETELSVLSLCGSEDKILNWEKYEENRGNLPRDFTEQILDGGCHAYFGMYGEQEGDGVPSVTNEEQIRWTKDAVTAFIENKRNGGYR